MSRSTLGYRSTKDRQDALRARLKPRSDARSLWLSAAHRPAAARRLARQRDTGLPFYAEEGLQVRTKPRRRIARRQHTPTPLASRPNQCRSMDFVSDKLADGRSFRIFTAVDQFTRECVCLEADQSMSGSKVVQWFERAAASRGGPPKSITLDNGSEFSGRALEAWAMQHSVQLAFIPPGRPVKNGFGESFNARVRDECLQDARAKLRSGNSTTTTRGSARSRALPTFDTADRRPCPGYARLPDATLDRRARPPKNGFYEGEALLRTARQNKRVCLEAPKYAEGS